MILFRPTGPKELKLVADSGWRAWPPRLPEQPIFYPVLNFGYAEQIARDWNSTGADAAYRGYVTRFEITDACAARYPLQIAGGAGHQELWVPAEELPSFNDAIVGKIVVVAAYRRGQKMEPLPHDLFA
jgi:hypothetical protein